MKLVCFLLACFLIAGCAPATRTPAPTPAADAEYLDAVAQARATLDEFTRRIQTPHPDRSFVALKVRFTSPDGSSQDIWVDHVSYVGGGFEGDMGDDIPALKLAFGERLAVPQQDILDWMIVEDNLLIGGYTIRLAYERMTPEEKQLFLKAAGYRIQ